MKKFAMTKIFTFLLLVVFCCATTVYALPDTVKEVDKILFSTRKTKKTAQAIKEDMKSRLAKVTEWKKSAWIGETFTGYLAVIDDQKVKKQDLEAVQKLIAEENSDRLEVYQAIAKEQKASVEMVGKRRAKQIYDAAGKGEFFQNEKGVWAAKTTDPQKK